VWATSWGVSTRLIGAVIMTHSDDKGLVLPPALSPEDAVIIPIYRNDSKAAVIAYAEKLEADLKAAGFKVVLDIDDSSSPGWKFTEWELRGTPVRIEIGPRDIKSNQVVMVRRDTGEKLTALSTEAATKLKELHNLIQSSLFERARSFRENNTKPISDLGGLIEFFGTETAGTEGAPGGFAEALWCGSAACEASIKEKTKATIRCLPMDKQNHIEGTCAICGAPAKYQAIFARNY